MPLDTRPSHSLTFAEACEIVMGSSRDLASPADAALLLVAAPKQDRATPPSLRAIREARYAALKAQAGVRPGKPVELSPLEAEALQRDRYNEPGPRRLPDDGFDVERWGRAGR